MRIGTLAAVLAVALAAPAAAGAQRGEGSGRSSVSPPPAKSRGPAEVRPELPARDLPVTPRHGLLGAPGAAMDRQGASRLGPRAPTRPALAGPGPLPTLPELAPSGDRIRSASSADVRASRRQVAPDLTFADEGRAPAQGGPTDRGRGGGRRKP